MKAFAKLLFVAFITMFGFASCDRQNEVASTIEIQSVVVTENTFVFTVKAKGVSKCAYMLYDGGDVTAQTVFTDGVVIKDVSAPVAVGNLKSGTTYHIVAAAKNSVGAVLSNTLTFTTKGNSSDNGGNNGGGNNDDNFELPEIDGVENVNIVKTNGGCWFEDYNYYVYFVLDNGDRIQLDFYTLSETMSLYLPYGGYTLKSNNAAYTFSDEGSCYLPFGWPKDEDGKDTFGYAFTDGYVTVDVVGGYYAIYMMLTYDADGEEKTIQGYWNGLLSNASVPAGDDTGSDKLIEVLEVGSTSFKFRINAAADQYWRCSVVDKRVYNQNKSNPGAWVVTCGFMFGGPLEINWENGKDFEYIPGYPMKVTASSDYLIIAALMDYSEGKENSLLGGVEIVEVRTNAESVGSGRVDVTMKQINVNDVVFDCVFGDNVWCCYVAMMKTADLQEIKDGKYLLAGYETFEKCMLSLIPGLSYDSMRQFLTSQYDYKWDYLNYGTSYTMCIKVVDMNNGATYIECEPFTTNR